MGTKERKLVENRSKDFKVPVNNEIYAEVKFKVREVAIAMYYAFIILNWLILLKEWHLDWENNV